MKARAEKFLSEGRSKHVKAVAFPQQRRDGKSLATLCLADAKQRHVSAKDIAAAADGYLVGYMFDALYHAAEAEVDRLLAKSKLDRLFANAASRA